MPSWVQAACADYPSQVSSQFKVQIEEIPVSKRGADAQTEHKKLLDRLKQNDFLVLLDERGRSYSTLG